MKIRFDFLDGIRGIAALWVVLYHTLIFNGYSDEWIKFSENTLINLIQQPLSIGNLAVAIFIVISGFSLAIPVVNNDFKLKGGFNRYIFRRAKRLIPPYYIALLFSLALYFIFPILQVPSNTAWDTKIPLTIGGIISHIGLFHNLNQGWIYKINGAHWSIATEWQIYWLFPIMLFLWRKWNIYVAILLISCVAMGLYLLVPYAAPEFLILFLLGVICCVTAFKTNNYNKSFLPFTIILLFITFLFFIIFKVDPLISNITTGIVFSLFLCALTLHKRLNNKNIYILESNPVKFLGKISYSLYLIHGPIIALGNLFLLKYYNSITDDLRLIVLIAIVIFIIIPISTLFYNIVERRFLNN